MHPTTTTVQCACIDTLHNFTGSKVSAVCVASKPPPSSHTQKIVPKLLYVLIRWCNWKSVILLIAGFLGGIFSAMSGSGIDICSFAILTLLFRVSEKISTPTSVMLMAGNTMIGFAYR